MVAEQDIHEVEADHHKRAEGIQNVVVRQISVEAEHHMSVEADGQDIPESAVDNKTGVSVPALEYSRHGNRL